MYSIDPTDTPLLIVPVYDRSQDEHDRKVQGRVGKEVPPRVDLGHVAPDQREAYREIYRRTREQAPERLGSRWLLNHQIGCFAFVGDPFGNVFGYWCWRLKSLISPYIKWPRCRVPCELGWVGKTYQGDPRLSGVETAAAEMRAAVEADTENRSSLGCWVDWNFWRPVPVLTQWLEERESDRG